MKKKERNLGDQSLESNVSLVTCMQTCVFQSAMDVAIKTSSVFIVLCLTISIEPLYVQVFAYVFFCFSNMMCII